MNYARFIYGAILLVGSIVVINRVFPPNTTPLGITLLGMIILIAIYGLTDHLLFRRKKH